MKKISVFNIKGGVAKTTSTANFGACLEEKGDRVLLVDLDPQSNLTKLFKAYSMEDVSIADVLLNKNLDIEKVIKKTDFENIDILPSNVTLAFAERKILLDVNKYDYCLIDCPPALNMITVNALCASDEVLVPIKIDKFALDGLEYLLDSIEEIKEEFNPNLNFKGCFITMDSSTTVNKVIKQELKSVLGEKMFNTSIHQNIKVVESTFEECPVVFSSKKARASLNYKDLSKEIF